MPTIRLILSLACVALFAGRAYEYGFFGAPLRVLFWDEQLFGPVVEKLLGREWQAYVTDLATDRAIDRVQYAFAAIFALAAAAVPLHRWLPRWLWTVLLFTATALLAFHAFLETKDHFYYLVQYGELTLQLVTAPLLWWTITRPHRTRWLVPVIAVATALTFTAHGLYALNVYPVPVHFLNMTIGITGWSERGSHLFLRVAGWLDLAAAVALFVPRLRSLAFFYCVVWGLLTALARFVYGLGLSGFPEVLHHYAYLTVYRLPHGLLPLIGFLLCGSFVDRAGTRVQGTDTGEREGTSKPETLS